MKFRHIFFIALCFHIGQGFSQNYKRAVNFSPTEKRLYAFLISNNVLAKSINPKDSFYILNKNSLFMLKCFLKKKDTAEVIIHLINQNNKLPQSSIQQWKIEAIEYVITGQPRLNPVFVYKKYFDDFDAFSSEFAAVQESSKWGIINGVGKIIIPIEFDEIKPHAFGMWVKKNNQVKIFSIQNNNQSSYFDEIGITAPKFEPSGFRLTIVKKNGKSSMLNSNLDLIMPLIYDNLTILGQKFLIGFRLKKVVVINPSNGKEVTQLYDKVRLSNNPDILETSKNINGKVIQGKVDTNGKEVE